MAATIRILYVDDEPSLLDIGKLFLEKGGAFTVDTLTSAIVALDRLKTKRYDAIISDYQMPDMDGITFLKQLKASGNKTPFIIFTGRGREEVVIEALNSGADFYIQKGGEPKSQFAELSHKIKTAVNRQKTEKLAKETERRLYDIINFLPDATFAIDTDGTVIAWNKAIEEMTGVPAHEMLGRGNYEYAIPFYEERRPILINLVSIPDEELTRGKYAVIKKEGDILIAETTLPRPLGRYSVLLGKASLLYNDEGTAIGAIESIRDITEQKQMEEALAESGRQLDAMATNIPGVVYRFCVNPDGTYGFDYIGERSRQILGLENDPVSFFNRVTEGIVPEERQRFISSVQHAINTKTLWEFDCWYVKPSGKKIWMSAVSSPVMENERLIFDGAIFDNTDRKRAEEELLKKNEELNASYEQIAAGEEELRANLDDITRQDLALSENEEKYRTVIEQSHDGIIISQDGILVFHNPSFASLTGYSSEELKHRSIADLIAPEDRELVLTRHRERLSGKTLPEVYEFSVLHHDGTSRIRVSMNITSASIGGRPATIGTLHNITEERRQEDALRESEEKLRLKLDSVLSPDVDLGEQDLANIIDTALIQSLMDDFFAVTGMPIGIVDLKGNVLVKTGWQDICNKFHRVHPETLKNCIESNLILSSGVPKGESHAYKCRNNMWDIVTPIFIGDKHIGNLFCGQFFYDDEVPDLQVFINHAEKYGFDKDKYLAALNSVPRWSREKIKNTMQFYAKFAEMVSKLSYSNLKLAKMISTQKQVEASLIEQEEQSRMLLSSMPDIVMVHHDGIIVYANQMALEKTGFSEEELIGSHLFDHVKETDREIILRNMKKRAAGELVGEYEIDMIHKSGLLHHVIIRASPIMFNQLPSIVFIIIDITERKRAEEALRESEEKYRLIFENSPLGHLFFDDKGVIVACNDKFIQIIGSSREALVGLNMLNLPDKNIVSAVQKALDGSNGLYEGVYSSVTAKKITPVRGLFAPMDFGDGRIPGGMGIFEDITERKNAEVLLKESELKYRSLIESSSDAIFCVDKNGEYKFTNLVFASTFDKTPEYFIGKTFWDIYPKEQADQRQSTNIRLFETGVTQTIEVEVPLPETTLYFIAKANPIKDETGKVILNLTHATDITDRKRAERAIQQANQKLLLLSSITRHDINNQLTVLQGYLELVEMKQDDHNLIDYCQKAITAAKRIYAMIRFTKEYESLGISAPTWHDTRTLIETTAKQAPLGKVIVKNDIPSGNEIFADPLIIKVCYNLMDNAVQYGKKITTIRFSVLKRNDEHLIICEDDGGGVLAEEKEKIFERGFGKNTGLGLALSREILSITGITIRETGEPGKGARFEMTVPKVMWRMTMREN